MKKRWLFIVLAVCWLLGPNVLRAKTLKIAVASNFTSPIKEIAKRFETTYGHKVILAFGSTGKHYAQIINGAPFELFFAADKKRPLLLEKENACVRDSRFTYALGKLTLWSSQSDFVDNEGKILEKGKFNHISIANPRLAPYGKAAQEVLIKRGFWKKYQPILVRGENIAQTFQFVVSGNAELGFIALSQVKSLDKNQMGSFWEIPQNLYAPIEQQAVIVKDSPEARLFISFIKGKIGREIIISYGYDLP